MTQKTGQKINLGLMTLRRIFLSVLLILPQAIIPVGAQQDSGNYFTVNPVRTSDGTGIEKITISGPPKPPPGFEFERQVVSLPQPDRAAGVNILTVPAFSWVFGCSAVSGAMIAAYYDRSGWPNIYTGPTNGGVMPLNNSSWSTWSDGSNTYRNCPLIASKNGVDGKATRGSIDDYWVRYDSSTLDPYITGSWTQHTWGEAIGDYMKTSQSAYGNTDGSTTFSIYTSSSSPLTCATMLGYGITEDGTQGRKLFYEARGYTVTDCYNQKTDNIVTGGFSFAQFKAEIDAGRPVMLNLAGHSIVGVGYDDSQELVYIHDTWDYDTHTMTWGSSYAGMQLLSVSIVNLLENDNTYTLTVNKAGSGSGTVASAPAGITCGTDCTGSYDAGTAVTLTATPGVASSFVGWAAGVCAGQNSVCALNMTATNQTVAAYFAGASIVAGGYHSLALNSDGTVWAWGNNGDGELGDGSTNNSRSTPVQVSGLSGVIALASGGYHSLALKSDGTVWAWGWNYYGQLGDGSTDSRSTPVQVSGLSGVIALAAGSWHSLALKSDGTVWAWGDNYYSQLGDGSTDSRSTPVQVSGLSGVIAIASGNVHSLALKSDGTVWAWGLNDYGQLGDGSTTDRSTPVQVSGLSGVIALAGGYYHTVALKSDGTVWAWGNNCSGELGDGSTNNSSSTPVQVSGLSGVIALAGGGWHSLALKSDGTVWAWGKNNGGQLGDGSTDSRPAPVQVSGLSGVIALAGGYYHTVALKSDGTVWAWGNNGDGQLGDGSASDRSTPVQTRGAGGSGFLNLHQATYLLTVGKAGTGSGTVTSSPAGISCGTDCSEPYTSGAAVTLTATAASGSTFAGWSGACTGTASTCTVSMSAAKTVTATFNLPRYTLTVGKAGTGSGTVTSSPAGISCGTDCSEPYTSGAAVTLTATTASGSTFAGWSGACTGTASTCKVSMSAAKTVTATFNRSMSSSYPTEAALLTTLDPGVYTAIVSSAGTTAGNALAEVFDQD